MWDFIWKYIYFVLYSALYFVVDCSSVLCTVVLPHLPKVAMQSEGSFVKSIVFYYNCCNINTL
jgi:hypothetical protein